MRPRVTGRRAAVAVAAFALLAACGGAGRPQAGAPTTSAAPVESGTPPRRSVPAALDFVAPALGGGEVRGADLAGRDVALWFWAPW